MEGPDKTGREGLGGRGEEFASIGKWDSGEPVKGSMKREGARKAIG